MFFCARIYRIFVEVVYELKSIPILGRKILIQFKILFVVLTYWWYVSAECAISVAVLFLL